jgi:hypothetical protein
MENLIDAIRTGIAGGASTEQKQQAAAACRAILTALDTEPGKPLAGANAPAPHPLAGIAPGQALDLLLAKLSAALPPDDKPRDPVQGSAVPERQGIRIKFIPAPTRPRSLGSSGRRPQAPQRKP